MVFMKFTVIRIRPPEKAPNIAGFLNILEMARKFNTEEFVRPTPSPRSPAR
jgi:hypothetical protein